MNQAVIDTILARRSIRSFTNEAVTQEQLDIILQCAVNAPSARNLQPWHLIVVRNRDWLDKFDREAVAYASTYIPDLPADRTILYNAPVAIFVCAHSENFFGGTDSGMLTQNILLSAQALGLGSCVVGMIRDGFSGANRTRYREELAIPEGYHPMYAIAIGHPSGEKPAPKERDFSKVTYLD